MNKILIVGHGCSGFSSVEKLLADNGVQGALPSSQENLSPLEIGKMLCQSGGIRIDDRSGTYFEYPVSQLAVGAVWDDLVMDLLLSNASQPNWGWSDPLAVYLLDFWKDAVPDLTFVLVYNHPKTAFYSLPDDGDPANGTAKDDGGHRAVESWKFYNDELLRFYRSNTDRCLLVHASRVVQSDGDPLLEEASPLALMQQGLQAKRPDAALAVPEDKTESTAAPGQGIARVEPENRLENALIDYIAQGMPVLTQDAMDLYDEMQSCATLPGRDQMPDEKNAIDAMAALRQLWAEKAELSRRLEQAEADARTHLAQKERLLSEREAHSSALLATQEQFEQSLRERRLVQTKVETLEQQSEWLSARWRESRDELTSVQAAHAALSAAHPIGAEGRVKAELPYVLGASMMAQARTVWKLLFLPFALFLVARRHRKEMQPELDSLPPAEAYSDFPKGMQVRKHLSYLLGSAWLAHIHKPWNFLVMPWALLFAFIQYRKYRKADRRDNT